MNTDKYNGFSNYNTWLVNHSIFNDMVFSSEPVTASELYDYALTMLFPNGMHNPPKLVEEFSKAFLYKVNFEELAELINDEIYENQENKSRSSDRDLSGITEYNTDRVSSVRDRSGLNN